MSPIRLMLVDDHNLVRAGFRSLLQNVADFEIVAEAEDGHSALRMIRERQPDLVLMDIALPDTTGLEITAQVKREYPHVKVVLLSMYDSEEYVLKAMQIGAAGYLLKDAGPGELEFAIRAVSQGEAYLSPAISKRVIESYHQRMSGLAAEKNGRPATGSLPEASQLTPRQSEVLQFIAEGYTTKEIAQQLGLSAKTVDAHRTQLMRQLDIHDIAGLVRYAVRVGLVKAE
ncbi:MAG: response regulator [Chloroflexota bacterium]